MQSRVARVSQELKKVVQQGQHAVSLRLQNLMQHSRQYSRLLFSLDEDSLPIFTKALKTA